MSWFPAATASQSDVNAAGAIAKARALVALGVRNLVRVGVYRAQLRLGIHRAQRLREPRMPTGPFYGTSPETRAGASGTESETRTLTYFGWHRVDVRDGVAWHTNPFTGGRVPDVSRPWWSIPDFDENVGDIKAVWEASRLDWAVTLARGGGRKQLDEWLQDWCASNPAYRGPNWKCGQETSLRILHLAAGALLLDTVAAPTPAIQELVAIHLERIDPTMGYAVGQDNNHGTSEAAALFVGGSWLAAQRHPRGDKWMTTGRRWLEERAARLIADDGSFSQYSVTYHRLMLDTFSLTEVWRQRMSLPAFSTRLIGRIHAAAGWLYALVAAESGDAPNIGGNDGAHLLQLDGAEFRDFRPSVQLAMALFAQRRAYDAPSADAYLGAFGVARPAEVLVPPSSRQFDHGGYSVLRCGDAFAVLRYPRAVFRPAHADPLHVDLFVRGENLLRDGGTFSYNAGDEWLSYFAGIRGHNTIQFDDREPMRRVGRFLWADWLRSADVRFAGDATPPHAGASYRDYAGARHARSVSLMPDSLRVEDHIAGVQRRAVLRWRLRPGAWQLTRDTVSDGRDTLRVAVNRADVRYALVTGWESRYYMQKTPLPVLEVAVAGDASFSSEYRWTPNA